MSRSKIKVFSALKEWRKLTKEDFYKWFKFMEVKPENDGKYIVTVYRFDGALFDNGSFYMMLPMNFDGKHWGYGKYKKFCYVCFIHRKTS